MYTGARLGAAARSVYTTSYAESIIGWLLIEAFCVRVMCLVLGGRRPAVI